MNLDSFSALLRDEICVLRIPRFCPASARRRLREFAATRVAEPYQAIGRVNGKPTLRYLGVDRIGTPFNLTYSAGVAERAVERYTRDAQTMREQLPANPITQLIAELNTIWPGGARLASFGGLEMHAGILRKIEAKDSSLGAAQPHFDNLPREICRLRKQFAVCVYLDVPKSGGELEIWNVPPYSPRKIASLEAGEDLRSTLPAPLRVTMRNGDLAIFNSRRPHAVRAFSKGSRLSLHCFMGLDPRNRLVLWS